MKHRFQHSDAPHILVIERQPYWRALCARVLDEAGFNVQTLGSYDFSPPASRREKPDLVVLGCASFGDKEQLLIKQIAGAFASRVVCEVNPGQEVARGEKYGMIKFGPARRSDRETSLSRGHGLLVIAQSSSGLKRRRGVRVLADLAYTRQRPATQVGDT